MNLQADISPDSSAERSTFAWWKLGLALFIPSALVLILVVVLIETLTTAKMGQFADLSNLVNNGDFSYQDYLLLGSKGSWVRALLYSEASGSGQIYVARNN